MNGLFIVNITWIDSAQDRAYWRVLVNVALGLRVPYVMELLLFT